MAAPRKSPRSAFNKSMTRELFKAIADSDTDIIPALVDAGADLEARNEDGLTPLLLAADERADQTVALLLKLGADINAQSTAEKYTALHYAAHNSDTDTLKLLVKAGAKLDIKDAKGLTPLHHAAIEADDDHVEYLLGKGADVLAKDNMGRTASWHAEKKSHEDHHYLADRYHKISIHLKLKEIAAQKEIDRKAAEEADRKAVQEDLEKLRKNYDPSKFRLKPPPKK